MLAALSRHRSIPHLEVDTRRETVSSKLRQVHATNFAKICAMRRDEFRRLGPRQMSLEIGVFALHFGEIDSAVLATTWARCAQAQGGLELAT